MHRAPPDFFFCVLHAPSPFLASAAGRNEAGVLTGKATVNIYASPKKLASVNLASTGQANSLQGEVDKERTAPALMAAFISAVPAKEGGSDC